jgi:hydrogenase maturation protein HypF
VLHELGRGDEIERRFGPVVGTQAARLLRGMLARSLNCPGTTSAGRWFDAAAGALGLSVKQGAEAEAAIALERAAAQALERRHDGVPFAPSLDLRGVVGDAFEVPRDDPAAIARAALHFHHALADGLADAAVQAAQRHGTDTVVLGGGCLMNRVLTERLAAQLQARGLSVYAPHATPCGDAGLALGQAWVAACSVAASRSASRDLALET